MNKKEMLEFMLEYEAIKVEKSEEKKAKEAQKVNEATTRSKNLYVAQKTELKKATNELTKRLNVPGEFREYHYNANDSKTWGAFHSFTIQLVEYNFSEGFATKILNEHWTVAMDLLFKKGMAQGSPITVNGATNTVLGGLDPTKFSIQ